MPSNFRIFKNHRNIQSEDFINLSEPPKPKDSPMLGFMRGNLDTVEGAVSGSSYDHPLFHRRRSTNYMDALTTKEKQRNKSRLLERVGDLRREHAIKHSQRRKSLLAGMDFQDTRHDMQTSNVSSDQNSLNSYTLDHHNMGDYIQHDEDSADRADYAPKPKHSLFKKQYRVDADSSGYQEEAPSDSESVHSKRFPAPGRKLSFEYEDFKKDIYNKLNFFEKK
ncbi:Igd1 protein [Maudiozyma humilis]|uniref:Igd1 protein n=1 Tax=Maudiozyma humilis TaxID=51915 RepID=A0AAV5RU71_MAUHU|nr:Igd1 protein [Kazachstania humilis]